MPKHDIPLPPKFKALLLVYNPKLSESSIKTRWSQFKTLCKNIGISPEDKSGCNPDMWNSHMESIQKYVDGLSTTDSKQNYTILAVVIIKALIKVIEEGLETKRDEHTKLAKALDNLNCDKLDEIEQTINALEKQMTQLKNDCLYYSGKVTEYKDLRNKEKDSGAMTTKQKENYISFTELESLLNKNTEFKLNELMKKERGEHTINDILDFQCILLCHLMIVAPSRTDFGDLQIIRSVDDVVPKDSNYLYLVGEDKYIQLNKWKTKKDVGSFRRIQLSKLGDVEKIILRYCDVLPTKKHVFENFSKTKELKAMSPSSFSKYVTKCFKTYIPDRSININLLRHIIVTHNKEKIKDVAELQNTLGHGAKTQGEYIFNA